MATATQSTPALEQRQCRYSELFLSRFSGLEIEMNRGSKDERKHHGAQNAANNSDGERLEHLRALPDGKGQWEHAGNGGESGHGNRTETAAAGLDHGVFRGKTESAEAVLGVQKENAVFCHDADDHDHANEGRDVKRRTSDEQCEQAAKGREQSGSQNRGWRGKGAELK